MFCPNCGTQSNDDAKFCYNCGFNLSSLSSQQNCNSIVSNKDTEQLPDKNGIFSTIKKKVSNLLSTRDNSYNIDTYMNDCALSNKVFFYLLLPNFVQSNSYLNEIYENIAENTSEEEQTNVLKAGINHLLDINLYEWKNDLEIAFFKNACTSIIDSLNDQTNFIMEDTSLREIFSNIIIEDNSKINFANQLYQLFYQSISNTYTSLLNQIQSLQSKKTLWKDINDSQVGDTLLSGIWGFAGGALAVANPIIGIPLLLGNFFKDKQKEKNLSNSIELIIDDYNKIMQIYDDMAKKRIFAIEEIQNIACEKIRSAIYQRNEILKQYKNDEELSVLYNEFIEDDSREIKDTIKHNPEFSFMIDILLDENISEKFKKLLNT